MRRTPLRARPPADLSGEPGYREWKAPVHGECAACGTRGLLLRHHVVALEHLRAIGAPLFDLRNALALGYYACACHRRHHSAVDRLPRLVLSEENVAFAVEVLGRDGAESYLARYYRV